MRYIHFARAYLNVYKCILQICILYYLYVCLRVQYTL